MTTADDQKQQPAKSGQAQAQAQITPEAETAARINVLQENLKTLEGELRTLSGRFANRDPAQVVPLQKENKELHDRLDVILRAYFALMSEATKPQQTEAMKEKLEVLKQSATEYFRKVNINPELWKNIAF